MYKWSYVNSSNVSALTVSGSDLIVRFNSGGIYRYYDAANEFDNLYGAVSVGKELNARLKGRYDFVKEY